MGVGKKGNEEQSGCWNSWSPGQKTLWYRKSGKEVGESASTLILSSSLMDVKEQGIEGVSCCGAVYHKRR